MISPWPTLQPARHAERPQPAVGSTLLRPELVGNRRGGPEFGRWLAANMHRLVAAVGDPGSSGVSDVAAVVGHEWRRSTGGTLPPSVAVEAARRILSAHAGPLP